MTQADLFPDPSPVRARRRSQVPASSVEAYQRTHADGRVAAVFAWLQEMVRGQAEPTSAELARWRWRSQGYRGPVSTDCVLYVRRGLSDALAKGLVEHAGKRTCSVAGTSAITWKVRTR